MPYRMDYNDLSLSDLKSATDYITFKGVGAVVKFTTNNGNFIASVEDPQNTSSVFACDLVISNDKTTVESIFMTLMESALEDRVCTINTSFLNYIPKLDDKFKKALEGLINIIERNECRHEETSRGGAIWTICQMCNRQWADNDGGMPEYKEPPELTAAYSVLKAL